MAFRYVEENPTSGVCQDCPKWAYSVLCSTHRYMNQLILLHLQPHGIRDSFLALGIHVLTL